ncbi:MAG: hypothetical protein HQ481_00555 [Alphaproteobacteria bacterium]|nr:hypothetical protein [Alphaproteobacteria bacterium]
MGLLGTGMLLTFTEVADVDEEEFNEWYNREHIDERVFMPGFKRARRYLAADTQTKVKYFASYETEKVTDLSDPEYMKLLGDQSPWSKKVMATFTYFDRLTLTCTVDLCHGVAGAAGLARFTVADKHAEGLRASLRDRVLPEIVKRPGMLGACLLENDLGVMNEGMKAQGRPIPDQQPIEWVVILDTMTPDIARSALAEGFGNDALASLGVASDAIETGAYSFIFGNQR